MMEGRVIVLVPGEPPQELPATGFIKARCNCGAPVHRMITLLSERWRVVLTYKGPGPKDGRRLKEELQAPCQIAIAYGDEEFIATAGEGR
jgi:hypothetical protein